MNIAKNPFSLYDFMGYIIPGSFLFLAIIAITDASYPFICLISDIDIAKFAMNESLKCNSTSFLAFLLISYILGHFLSYSSAMTIEFFSNRLFRYPSKYLLKVPDTDCSPLSVKLFKTSTSDFNILPFLAYVICLPVTGPMTIFATLEFTRNYIQKAADDQTIDAITKKTSKYSKTIDYNYEPRCECCDTHRIIMHFVTVNIPNAQRKTENYVALYGFLRSMSLALSLVFICGLFSAYKTTNAFTSGDERIYIALSLLAIAPSISYLGYLKFYRRHTLENLMSFLVFPLSSIGIPDSRKPKGKKHRKKRRPRNHATE